MNSKLIGAIAFVAGAAIGSVVTWKLVEARCLNIANEEIESTKEHFKAMLDEALQKQAEAEKDRKMEYKPMVSEFTQEPAKPVREKPDILEYKEQLESLNYKNKKEGKEEGVECPYVISPDEFGELYEYETNSLTYYADGVLADDAGDIIEDVDTIVGLDSLEHIGEYEEDAVHVRNDMLMSDYEILRDVRNYSEIDFKPPHLVD